MIAQNPWCTKQQGFNINKMWWANNPLSPTYAKEDLPENTATVLWLFLSC